MALKTFNLNAEIYKEFSKHCKKEGHSMSKKVEKFIQGELEKIKRLNPKAGFDKGVKEFSKREEKKGEVEHSFRKYC